MAIGKAYSIFCDECTKYTNLVGQSVKDCEAEAKGMGWTFKKPHTYCPECSANMAQQAANPERS